jgi:GNAT superfamily N-acetyltransferase
MSRPDTLSKTAGGHFYHRHMDVSVRPATVEDAGAIGAVHVRSWQGAYVGLLPQDHLDAMDPVRSAAAWRRWLAAADDRSRTLLAEVGGRVVGFANVRPSRDADADPATVGEVTTIYLLPDSWGTGIGRMLFGATRDALVAAGYRAATLWVLDTNDRARRFYEAAGWRPDGATKVDDSMGLTLAEVRYRIEPVSPAPR